MSYASSSVARNEPWLCPTRNPTTPLSGESTLWNVDRLDSYYSARLRLHGRANHSYRFRYRGQIGTGSLISWLIVFFDGLSGDAVAPDVVTCLRARVRS